MTAILILLLPAAYLSIFIWLYHRSTTDGVRANILRATILTALYAILSLEVLSPFHLVTRPALVMVWCLPLVVFCAWAVHLYRSGGHIVLPAIKFPHKRGEWLAFSGIAIILLVTVLIAWVAPPMTWDSMSYHMSRIAHWAQNRSIWHYITGIERQNSMSPGAEMLTLHGYVLAGSDRFTTFTEWFAMLGSIIGVSLITKKLGGKPYAQWLAALFVVSLPMGITQASSTITDYVVAFWLVCLANETLEYQRSRVSLGLIFAVLASALAVLTKPTCLPYLLPFILWIIVLAVRSLKPLALLRWALIALGLTALVTGGYLTRNLVTYGGLSNPDDFKNHINQLMTPAGLLSNVIKNTALHAGTPSDYLNNELDILIRKVHVKIGVDIMDPRTTGDGTFMIREPSFNEDAVSNPYHAITALVSLIIIIFLVRKLGWKALLYAGCVIAGFVFYSGFYKWHLFNVRYHLSFFVLFGAVFGLAMGAFIKVRWGAAVSILLWLTSIPWLISLPSRPLLPIAVVTNQPSILSQTRAELRFTNCKDCQPVFSSLVEQIEAVDCSQIGIMLNGDAGEYLFWRLFTVPIEMLRIEWIVAGTPSDRYKPMDFEPCAVICEGCGAERTSIRGLNLFSAAYGYSLYMNASDQ
jgi:hypothetical protein